MILLGVFPVLVGLVAMAFSRNGSYEGGMLLALGMAFGGLFAWIGVELARLRLRSLSITPLVNVVLLPACIYYTVVTVQVIQERTARWELMVGYALLTLFVLGLTVHHLALMRAPRR